MVITVSFVLSPAIGLFCHRPRSRCVSIVTRLTSASRGQDHTTSPSAPCVSSLHMTRPSQPAPDTRDDRVAPLLKGRGPGRAGASDLPVGTSGIFRPQFRSAHAASEPWCVIAHRRIHPRQIQATPPPADTASVIPNQFAAFAFEQIFPEFGTTSISSLRGARDKIAKQFCAEATTRLRSLRELRRVGVRRSVLTHRRKQSRVLPFCGWIASLPLAMTKDRAAHWPKAVVTAAADVR